MNEKEEKMDKEIEEMIRKEIEKDIQHGYWREYFDLAYFCEYTNMPNMKQPYMWDVEYTSRNKIMEKIEDGQNARMFLSSKWMKVWANRIFESLWREEEEECRQKKCEDWGWDFCIHWEGYLARISFGNPECKTCQENWQKMGQKYWELYPDGGLNIDVDCIRCIAGVEFYPDFQEQKIYIIQEEEED